MKIGFSKDGLKLNSKKFHPLNMAFKGFEMESDINADPINPAEILGVFESITSNDAAKMDKINILKKMLEIVDR